VVPVKAEAADLAQKAGEFNGKRDTEYCGDGPGTMCDGDGVRDEASVSRHLRAERCWGGPESVPKLVRVGAGDAEIIPRTTRGAGPSFPDGRGSLGEDTYPLDWRSDDRSHGAA
jgi:hypothetical protein